MRVSKPKAGFAESMATIVLPPRGQDGYELVLKLNADGEIERCSGNAGVSRETQLKKLQAKVEYIEQMKEQLLEANSALQDLKQKQAGSDNTIKQITVVMQKTAEEQALDLVELRSEAEELKAKAQADDSTIGQLKQQLAESEDMVKQLKEQQAGSEVTITKLKETVARKEAEVDAAKNANDGLCKLMHKLEAKFEVKERSSEEGTATKIANESLCKQVEILESQLEALSTKSETQALELVVANTNRQELRTQLDQVLRTVESQEAQGVELKQKLNLLEGNRSRSDAEAAEAVRLNQTQTRALVVTMKDQGQVAALRLLKSVMARLMGQEVASCLCTWQINKAESDVGKELNLKEHLSKFSGKVLMRQIKAVMTTVAENDTSACIGTWQMNQARAMMREVRQQKKEAQRLMRAVQSSRRLHQSFGQSYNTPSPTCSPSVPGI